MGPHDSNTFSYEFSNDSGSLRGLRLVPNDSSDGDVAFADTPIDFVYSILLKDTSDQVFPSYRKNTCLDTILNE